MKIDEFVQKARGINFAKKGDISELYDLLLSINFKSITINELKNLFSDNYCLHVVLIGFWAFDLLKKPKLPNTHIIGYDGQPLSEKDEKLIKEGLLLIIKNCNLDDGNCVDCHYSACGSLYRLAGEQTEKIIIDEINADKNNLKLQQLIEALGIIVSTQNQGYLLPDTVGFLKKLALGSNDTTARDLAKSILIEDVARVDQYSHFLIEPLDLF